MGRRTKNQGKRTKPARGAWWRSLEPAWRRSLLIGGAKILALAVGGLAAGLGLSRLDAHVGERLLDDPSRPELTFIDLPPVVERLGGADLAAVTSDLLDQPWTDPRLCPAMGERLTGTGWIARLNFVRRTGDRRFEVSARYRVPVAMVQQDRQFLLIDPDGVRLPGAYFHEPRWKLIQGVRAAPPAPGEAWPGEDLQAALRLLAAVSPEPFEPQISGVIVENYAGRVAAERSHVELATDRPEGRIRWGSAPGLEVEENTVGQKLAILRANFQRTGRADAGHAVIDISTFPDRFTVSP